MKTTEEEWFEAGRSAGRKEAEGESLNRDTDETRKLARDLLLTYIRATGQFLNKVEVQEVVRAARWLMEEWRNPTPDPPAPQLSEE